MNRRQFLGASLGASIAAAALPWDPFLEWCSKWLGAGRRRDHEALRDITAELQRLIDEAALGGGAVVVPHGEYRLSAPLVFPPGDAPIVLDGNCAKLHYDSSLPCLFRCEQRSRLTIQHWVFAERPSLAAPKSGRTLFMETT